MITKAFLPKNHSFLAFDVTSLGGNSPASCLSQRSIRNSTYIAASFRVWILLSLSEGRVGTMALSLVKDSLRLMVLARSLLLACSRWTWSCSSGT